MLAAVPRAFPSAAIGIFGKCSLTGKTGLAEKKPQPLASGCTPALQQLVHMEQSVMENQCFWKKAAAFGSVWSKHSYSAKNQLLG